MTRFSSTELEFLQKILTDQCHAPNMLLRHYQDLGLSDRDCILLMTIISAFPTDRNYLTIEDVKQYWHGYKEDIHAVFADFVKRRFLTKAKNRGVSNCYTLDGFYRQLYETWIYLQACPCGESEPGERKKPLPKTEIKQIYRSFEAEKGQPLSQIELETINKWLIEDNWSAEMLKEALTRAVLHGTCSFAYIDRILLRWQKEGIRSMEQLTAEKTQVKKTPKKNRSQAPKADKNTIIPAETDYNDIYNY